MKKWKMKKHIPYGPYCYTVIGRTDKGIKVKRCPFYKHMGLKIYKGEYDGKSYKEEAPLYKCTFCGLTSDDEFLLSDSVKICGVHEDY